VGNENEKQFFRKMSKLGIFFHLKFPHCIELMVIITGVFFKFGVEVGVEESIVNAPPDYNSDQLFKCNLTFCVFLIFSLKNQSFLRRMVHSQSTLQRQLRR
jgi:hypothetical protein